MMKKFDEIGARRAMLGEMLKHAGEAKAGALKARYAQAQEPDENETGEAPDEVGLGDVGDKSLPIDSPSIEELSRLLEEEDPA